MLEFKEKFYIIRLICKILQQNAVVNAVYTARRYESNRKL